MQNYKSRTSQPVKAIQFTPEMATAREPHPSFVYAIDFGDTFFQWCVDTCSCRASGLQAGDWIVDRDGKREIWPDKKFREAFELDTENPTLAQMVREYHAKQP